MRSKFLSKYKHVTENTSHGVHRKHFTWCFKFKKFTHFSIHDNNISIEKGKVSECS